MNWSCEDCGFSNPEGVDKCSQCGSQRPGTRVSDTAPLSEHAGPRHGWRLTLPNHVTVPLNDGEFLVGRATEGLVGQVLQLFDTVSREHLRLNVTADHLEVILNPTATSPTFEYAAPDAGQPELATPRPLKPNRVRALSTSDSLTLCLGQCCFIRIDRGEA